ncbi:MAG TPA: hypothetical protein VF074_15670 [Pyrinomonadaceae bacterium]
MPASLGGKVQSYFESRRTMNAIGRLMQKMITSMPMIRLDNGTGRRATADKGRTMKFMKR